MQPRSERVIALLQGLKWIETVYDVYVTDQRLLFAKVGKSYRLGHLLSSPETWALGPVSVGAGPEGGYAGMNLDQVLASDGENFEISLGRVERMMAHPGSLWSGSARIEVTSGGKTDVFSLPRKFDKNDPQWVHVKRSLSIVLPGKFVIEGE